MRAFIGGRPGVWSTTRAEDQVCMPNDFDFPKSNGKNPMHYFTSVDFARYGTGCWVLGTGYWVLGTGCWVLGTRSWVLGTGYWVLGTGYWGRVWPGPELISGMRLPGRDGRRVHERAAERVSPYALS
eukprot:820640-Rhodomonas_salina.1